MREMQTNCSLCQESLARSEIALHMEENHEEFNKAETPYFICCGVCENRVLEGNVQSMLDHCFNSGHSSTEIYTEWQKSICAETKRIQELVAYGLQLLGSSGESERLSSSQKILSRNRKIKSISGIRETHKRKLGIDTAVGHSSVSRAHLSSKPSPVRILLDLSAEVEQVNEELKSEMESNEENARLPKKNRKTLELPNSPVNVSKSRSSRSSTEINKDASSPAEVIAPEIEEIQPPIKRKRGRKSGIKHPIHNLFRKIDSDAACIVGEPENSCGWIIRCANMTNMCYHAKTRHPEIFTRIEKEWELLQGKSGDSIDLTFNNDVSDFNQSTQPDKSRITGEADSSVMETGYLEASIGQAGRINIKKGRLRGVKHPVHSFFEKKDSNAICQVENSLTEKSCGWVIRSAVLTNMNSHLKSRHPEIFNRVEKEWEALRRKSLEQETYTQ